MTCPYFRDEYVGLCTAKKRPYVPSIDEMERYCFKVYEQCWAFRDDGCSATVTHHTLSEDPEDRGGLRRSELTAATYVGTPQRNSQAGSRRRLR